jgi:hypothetical protein
VWINETGVFHARETPRFIISRILCPFPGWKVDQNGEKCREEKPYERNAAIFGI